mmetsp:Transcript_46749/g.121055  ORF Transcript_46749/g.121055 Transcript_46749/m.121055 type:complete len:234 (-) Transcript_46749:365-1066(-)
MCAALARMRKVVTSSKMVLRTMCWSFDWMEPFSMRGNLCIVLDGIKPIARSMLLMSTSPLFLSFGEGRMPCIWSALSSSMILSTSSLMFQLHWCRPAAPWASSLKRLLTLSLRLGASAGYTIALPASGEVGEGGEVGVAQFSTAVTSDTPSAKSRWRLPPTCAGAVVGRPGDSGRPGRSSAQRLTSTQGVQGGRTIGWTSGGFGPGLWAQLVGCLCTGATARDLYSSCSALTK